MVSSLQSSTNVAKTLQSKLGISSSQVKFTGSQVRVNLNSKPVAPQAAASKMDIKG